MYGSSHSLFESNWDHDLSYLFVMQISPSIIIICWICMTKRSDNPWFQFDSTVVCAVTHIKKRIFPKLACFVIFPDHFLLPMRIGNLISIIKIFLFWQILCTKLGLNAEFKGNRVKHYH